MDYGRRITVPSYDISFCVPANHSCATTECPRHVSHAPEGTIVSWTDAWSSCASKTEKLLPYLQYKGNLNGSPK